MECKGELASFVIDLIGSFPNLETVALPTVVHREHTVLQVISQHPTLHKALFPNITWGPANDGLPAYSDMSKVVWDSLVILMGQANGLGEVLSAGLRITHLRLMGIEMGWTRLLFPALMTVQAHADYGEESFPGLSTFISRHPSIRTIEWHHEETARHFVTEVHPEIAEILADEEPGVVTIESAILTRDGVLSPWAVKEAELSVSYHVEGSLYLGDLRDKVGRMGFLLTEVKRLRLCIYMSRESHILSDLSLQVSFLFRHISSLY